MRTKLMNTTALLYAKCRQERGQLRRPGALQKLIGDVAAAMGMNGSINMEVYYTDALPAAAAERKSIRL
jgi:hypothetical protein